MWSNRLIGPNRGINPILQHPSEKYAGHLFRKIYADELAIVADENMLVSEGGVRPKDIAVSPWQEGGGLDQVGT